MSRVELGDRLDERARASLWPCITQPADVGHDFSQLLLGEAITPGAHLAPCLAEFNAIQHLFIRS